MQPEHTQEEITRAVEDDCAGLVPKISPPSGYRYHREMNVKTGVWGEWEMHKNAA